MVDASISILRFEALNGLGCEYLLKEKLFGTGMQLIELIANALP
jgi:hypothetical protein